MRRAGRLTAAVTAAAVLAAGGWAAGRNSSATADDSGTRPTIPTSTATVSTRLLSVVDTFSGTVSLDSLGSVPSRLAGTLTAVAGEGASVDRGAVLFRVDEQPVVLLIGGVPAYRTMAADTSPGKDVRQLEENLVALGHARASNLKVDDKWDASTTAAVKRWQKAIGAAQDGTVDLGEVVFLPAAAKVSRQQVKAGLPVNPGDTVVDLTSAVRIVTFSLAEVQHGLVKAGDSVTVRRRDGSRVTGVVRSVTTTSTEDGDDTTKAVVTVDDQASLATLDGSSVSVDVARESKEALAVPVHALLSVPGGYALEPAEAGAPLVKVEVGLFADGYVEVRGEGVREGMKVVVPS